VLILLALTEVRLPTYSNKYVGVFRLSRFLTQYRLRSTVFSRQSGSLKNRGWRWLTDRSSTLKVLARFRLQIHYCNCDIEVALCSTLLLFKCTKNPTARSSGRSGPQAVSPDVLPLARIALAPRSCPFPVSSTVAVVNTPLARRTDHYTQGVARVSIQVRVMPFFFRRWASAPQRCAPRRDAAPTASSAAAWA
jgi:hypothetical protein